MPKGNKRTKFSVEREFLSEEIQDEVTEDGQLQRKAVLGKVNKREKLKFCKDVNKK